MNTEKVFIGQYNNEEVLVYRKENNYIDLINKGSIYKSEDIKIIMPFKKLNFDFNCNMFKRNIIKVYNNDREELLSLNKLLIGDLYRVKDIKLIQSGNIEKFGPFGHYDILDYNYEKIQENVLIYHNKYNKFINPASDIEYIEKQSIKTFYSFIPDYKSVNLKSGLEFIDIDKCKKFISDSNSNYLQKKLVLKKYNNL